MKKFWISFKTTAVVGLALLLPIPQLFGDANQAFGF